MLIARLLKDKGVYEYIETAKIIKKRFPEAEFLLAGGFDTGNPTAIKPNEVENWANENIIRYLGKTDTIKDFFIQTDVIVLPSYREGLSRLLLEAASCQKPLIATNVPGCKELVDENMNGFLCEPKSVDSLVHAITKMISLSPSERKEFGVNSRKIVQDHFGKERVNAIYLKMIREVIG
jgi:glycosyltransferase involved in cell wall biosynthesis